MLKTQMWCVSVRFGAKVGRAGPGSSAGVLEDGHGREVPKDQAGGSEPMGRKRV
jgi:hypothetical protein